MKDNRVLGEVQEQVIAEYEPKAVNITFEKDDLRTLIHIHDLGLDKSGIIYHIFDSIRVDYPKGGV